MPKINQEDDFDDTQLYSPAAAVLANDIKTNVNPLSGWMRAPGVHVKLPSNAAFMPPGSVNFTMSGEVPVFPMRGADELLLKSPDALMSGYAIEELVRSCVPAIRFPRLLSSPDLDVILLAIRAATYGEVMHFSPVCPACQATNQSHRNLSFLLANMTFLDPENPVRLSDEVVVYVRPYNLTNATKIGVASFEEARKLQAIDGAEVELSAKTDQMNSSMRRISDLTTDTMSDCVLKVVVPGHVVTDKLNIKEFIANISKAWTDEIQKKLDELNSKGIEKKYDIQCSECQHEWPAEIEFNPSTFFAASS